MVKNLPAMRKSGFNALEKGMATHSNILSWRIRRRLAAYNPWGHRESDTNEWLTHTHTRVCTHTHILPCAPKNGDTLYTIDTNFKWLEIYLLSIIHLSLMSQSIGQNSQLSCVWVCVFIMCVCFRGRGLLHKGSLLNIWTSHQLVSQKHLNFQLYNQ